MRAVFRGLLELLAPPSCAGCDLPVTSSCVTFCDACRPLLEPAPPGLSPPSHAAAAYVFEGPLRDSIRRFKYAGRIDLAPALGAVLAQAAEAHAGRIDLVAPLPLHPRKLRARGYSPAALLARPVASALGVPVATDLLRRVGALRPQASLTADARANNVVRAFEPGRPTAPRRVLVVDDVRTTGSTLAAAAATLTALGHEVSTLALACALRG